MAGQPIPPTDPIASPGGAGSAPAAEAPSSGERQEVPSVTQLEGKTEIDDNLRFEVEALAHAAASQVAGEIAARVSSALAPSPPLPRVLLLDERLALALGLHRTLVEQCEILKGSFDTATATANEGLAALDRKDTEVGHALKAVREHAETATARTAKFSIDPTGVIAAGLSAATNLLGFFNVDTRYYGREAEVSQQALVMELARKLLARGISFRWPSFGVTTAQGRAPAGIPSHLDGLHEVNLRSEAAISAIHRLSLRVHQLDDDSPQLPPARLALDRAHAAYDSPAAVFGELREAFLRNDQEELRTSPAFLLQLAADVLATEDTVFLTARVEAAGGSYRIRRHLFQGLWQFLTGRDPLTVSGGVVVSFALLNAEGDFLKTGTLRHRGAFEGFRLKATDFDQQADAPKPSPFRVWPTTAKPVPRTNRVPSRGGSKEKPK